jgi:hypothetical protein
MSCAGWPPREAFDPEKSECSLLELLAFLHCTIWVAVQTEALKSAIIAGTSAYTQHDMPRKTKTPN